METAKVYIVNQSGHNFSAAKRFGVLVPITEGNINVFRPDRDMFAIQQVLKDFNAKKDYLLLTGNVFANALAALTIALVKKAKSVNLLVFDAKQQEYLCHTIEYDRLEKSLRRPAKEKKVA